MDPLLVPRSPPKSVRNSRADPEVAADRANDEGRA